MNTLKLHTNDEMRAMQSIRRRPEVELVKVVLTRALADARAAYEATASEDLRSKVDAHKAMIAALFDTPLVLEE